MVVPIMSHLRFDDQLDELHIWIWRIRQVSKASYLEFIILNDRIFIKNSWLVMSKGEFGELKGSRLGYSLARRVRRLFKGLSWGELVD